MGACPCGELPEEQEQYTPSLMICGEDHGQCPCGELGAYTLTLCIYTVHVYVGYTLHQALTVLTCCTCCTSSGFLIRACCSMLSAGWGWKSVQLIALPSSSQHLQGRPASAALHLPPCICYPASATLHLPPCKAAPHLPPCFCRLISL